MKFLGLIVKNIGRNLIRSILTALGTMMLVFVVTLVWSILSFLNVALSEKNANFKAIITERWQIPSQMPYTYAATLSEGAATKPDDVRPMDSMTWQFYGGSIEKDRAKRGMNNVLFAFSLEPKKLLLLPGGHYAAYTDHFGLTSAAARDWFVEHLIDRPSG